jgi:hypothetical protein
MVVVSCAREANIPGISTWRTTNSPLSLGTTKSSGSRRGAFATTWVSPSRQLFERTAFTNKPAIANSGFISSTIAGAAGANGNFSTISRRRHSRAHRAGGIERPSAPARGEDESCRGGQPGRGVEVWGLGTSLELGAWDLKLPNRVIPSKTARNHFAV